MKYSIYIFKFWGNTKKVSVDSSPKQNIDPRTFVGTKFGNCSWRIVQRAYSSINESTRTCELASLGWLLFALNYWTVRWDTHWFQSEVTTCPLAGQTELLGITICLTYMVIINKTRSTVFPHIVSAETILFWIWK